MRHTQKLKLHFASEESTSSLLPRSWVVACVFALLTAVPGWSVPPTTPKKKPGTTVASPSATAKAKPKPQKAGTAQPDPFADLSKYPGLLEEFGRLSEKMERDIRMPAPRSQSRLLRIMPESTSAYAALPNYGGPVRQALDILHEEMKSSPVLREWWQKNLADSKGVNLDSVLQKYSDFSDYLGDEVVLSGTIKEKDGGLIAVAEIKKPGLEEFLRSAVKELAGKSTPPRILSLRELASAKDSEGSNKSVILVGPELVVFGSDLKTVREFNAGLGTARPSLEKTAFGKRIGESYQRGVEVLVAADLQNIVNLVSKGNAQDQRLWQRSGFADLKYAIWEYAKVTGQAPSQAELSFIGPRRGIASWLAAPAHMTGLEFVSPDAAMVLSVLLKNPSDIFTDIKELTNSPSSQGPQRMAALEPVLTPILSQLTGEITAEFQPLPSGEPQWKLILGIKDLAGFQQAISPLLFSLQPRETVMAGVAYYSLQVPNANKPIEISYTFQDGYLLLGSSRKTLQASLLARRKGESLATSEKYLAALPPGHSAEASAIMYQNSGAFLASMMGKMPPEISRVWSQAATQSTSVANAVYGEETAIRSASKSGTSSVAPAMIVAAIAIPNLLRARIAANESSAVGSMRTVNVAQITYASTYPEKGFARDLATLGSGAAGIEPSADHAQLLDSVLGCPTGNSGHWCIRNGYKFTIAAKCSRVCEEFVSVATPASAEAGKKNFCSTTDGVIRFKAGPPLTSVISASECASWEPLH